MRRQITLGIVTGLFATASCLWSAGPVSAQTIRLTYSNFFPSTHIQSIVPEAWCKEVEKRTGGKVKVDYFPGSTLTKPNQSFEGVLSGLSDLANVVPGYTPGRFPILEMVDLPWGYTSARVATSVASALYEKYKELEKGLDGVKVFYLHAYGPGIIFTRGKPVRTLEELKGVKLRAHGTSARVARALGATPVSIPIPDVYESLHKGTIDGGMLPLESLKGWRLADVTDWVTANFATAYSTCFIVVMNKTKWNSLPEDAKKAMDDISKEWSVKHAEGWDNADSEGLTYFLTAGKGIVGLNPGESKKWKEKVRPMFDEAAKELDGKGLPGKDIVKYTGEMVEKYQK